MRPPRVAILALFFSASLFLVCRSISSFRRTGTTVTTTTTRPKSSFRAFFSFTTPFSLFPPNALISLTDDNSTFFPARPAAFGRPLVSNGLSGQLWIGSGFPDDTLQDGEGEGELGCSDIPGWEDGRARLAAMAAAQGLGSSKHGSPPLDSTIPSNEEIEKDSTVGQDAGETKQSNDKSNPVNDGTDDYLHEALQQTKGGRHSGRTTASGSSHADIQSIQESAEITGKIVLLSRGGCGFVEKVKWAQRRGALALIVGDNQRGGPLIQMFARGNVDNVTIPSVFTSRTTAHLLASLMDPGGTLEHTVDENGNPIVKVQHAAKSGKDEKGNTPQTKPSAPEKRASKAKKAGRNRLTKLLFGKSAIGDADNDGSGQTSAPKSASVHSQPGHYTAREGLWVTITPTGGASPFFDTLLVLVVSPLITLTVVYALLILRVKIRMRRWRAPKSVVDQLPGALAIKLISHDTFTSRLISVNHTGSNRHGHP
ncbi:hypothetical protein N0V88_003500 [Collariella sp. IMI 366227]|nr:hypothetical protein N0V88_003500 [Collariella sp. IMI 366227]